jgi:hypothetical protein
MAFASGTQFLANAMSQIRIEFVYLNFALIGDTTGEVDTTLKTLFGFAVGVIGAPDGAIYLNEAGQLADRSAFTGTTGKQIDVPATGKLTFARDGTPAGQMQAFVMLVGV